MKKNIFPIIVLFILSATVYSQKKRDVLLTIDDEPVLVSEFKKVFNKNLNLVQEEDQKSVDGYLGLFIDYKLKVVEAKAQGLDKSEDYKSEFLKYREQLSRNYLFDKKVTEELTIEAYERGLEEIDADHILVMITLNALPKDSLIAYNKIKTIRDKAVNGEDFETLAKKYSEEPGAKERGGKLAYFSVFNMVYDFETEAYKTKVGEISEIVRTEFGYHIIKVNDRRVKKHKVNVSHIMIFDNEDKKEENPKERIDELYAMVTQGERFESVAKQFSEDRNTAIQGGRIKTFGPGDLRAPGFEKAAYALKEEGEISKPIKSAFGWHVIRLNKKYPIPTYKEQREIIEKKVTGGARAMVVTKAANEKIKTKYGYQKGNGYSPYMNEFVSDSILSKNWEYIKVSESENKMLFKIGDKEVTYDDFAKFIAEKQNLSMKYDNKDMLLSDYYKEFHNNTLKEYFKVKLEEDNDDFASVLDEYRNGLLIFDVMDKNIWKFAKSDSVGLQKYYEQTKKNYLWKTRIVGDIFSATNNNTAKIVQKLLEKKTGPNEIKEQLNTDGKINVIVNSGTYEIDKHEIPKDFDAKTGISEIYQVEDSFVVLHVTDIIPASVKEMEAVRGIVLSNYQNHLEKKWMSNLRKKYKVVLNERVLKRVKKELNP